jgi:hypothetical protein
LTDQTGGAAHRGVASVGRHVAPGFVALLCGGQRDAEVGDAATGDLANQLAGGGIANVERLAALGIGPFVGMSNWLVGQKLSQGIFH